MGTTVSLPALAQLLPHRVAGRLSLPVHHLTLPGHTPKPKYLSNIYVPNSPTSASELNLIKKECCISLTVTSPDGISSPARLEVLSEHQ